LLLAVMQADELRRNDAIAGHPLWSFPFDLPALNRLPPDGR
jgi:hypothetical protein